MKDEIVHQVDTPTKLYNKPNNICVVGFIGSSQMNFIDARFDGNELIAGGTGFEIPHEKVETLREKGYTGKTVIPENYSDIIGIGGDVNYYNFQDAELLADVSGYKGLLDIIDGLKDVFQVQRHVDEFSPV